MIRIPRSLPPPASLTSPRAARARTDAVDFFGLGEKERAQRRFAFDRDVFAAPAVVRALRQLFHSKCAYCEQPVRPLLVDHFRPPAEALALDGRLDRDHYWWLAYEWENLYAACSGCTRMKSSRFPVSGQRAGRGDDLAPEGPQLLDPCADAPETHLAFLEDGHVVPKDERGRVTIEVLGLNRTELVQRRARAATAVRAAWIAEDFEELASIAQDDARPFAALCREIAAELEPTVMAEAGPSGRVPAKAKRALKRQFDVQQTAQEAYSVANVAKKEDYFIRSRLVERVVVRNFRAIEELDLELSRASGELAPWLMLLGENGTGKSSVLQAVALTLVGEQYRRKLGVDVSRLVRTGAQSGEVEVYLSGGTDPLRLRFSRRSKEFRGGDQDPKVLLLGYGATRLLPRRGSRVARAATRFAHVDNLFDPFVPLADAEKWLLGLEEDRFDTVARALKGILVLDDEATIVPNRRSKRIEVETTGPPIPLEHLSDGYQSALALAADVMQVLLHRWPAMEVAEGIVVVDELGSHLHPGWRMRITSSLRETFPRVQFLASTHDPLCLRGLLDGEVALLRRTSEGRVFAVRDLPSVAGLRVDQLLTSEFFGLNSTIDPELDRTFARYYELRAKEVLSGPEQGELDRLRAQLEEHRVLGTTRRERLMLEAADKFLAQEAEITNDAERHDLREETKREIAAIWSEVGKQRRRR
ncbi:MAG: AAA family ATPase [Actinobacteria bacterium]|nr:AAA family ATPase [Actinomycetota bacterium]